jgi:hypothetical protein
MFSKPSKADHREASSMKENTKSPRRIIGWHCRGFQEFAKGVQIASDLAGCGNELAAKSRKTIPSLLA